MSVRELFIRRRPPETKQPREVEVVDYADPPGWVPVTLDPHASRPTPEQPGPYLVGYREDWVEYEEWGDAWTAHLIRGTTLFASHLLAADRPETP